MRLYIAKRLLQVIPTIIMITLVVFTMMRSIPGDPIVALLGDAYDAENAARLRQEYGLDRPIIVQYVIWLGKLLQGDWGTSYLTSRSVLNEVLIRLPITVELIVLAMVAALLIALPAGIIAALRQNTWADYTAMTSALVGISIPDFFLGVLLLLIFSFGLNGLLPSSGWVYLPGTCPTVICQESLWGNLAHVIMPAIALGIGRAAILTRLLRASMLEVIRTEYITTARSKGLPENIVIVKHALKNALIPTVTIMGLQVGFLIGGAIVVETLFAIPGLGTFGINAIITRDYQQVQGFILLVAICFVLINFLVDMTYSFLDPRIRYGGPG
jgi:peptide/nickel transport system permease protein